MNVASRVRRARSMSCGAEGQIVNGPTGKNGTLSTGVTAAAPPLPPRFSRLDLA
jgi:hypothetical protein